MICATGSFTKEKQLLPNSGDDDFRIFAPPYLAVIQRSAFRHEGSLFDCSAPQPA
jgi:hypothetical protein